MQLGSHQNVMRCCTGWCESPAASMPLPLLESGDLLCGCSVLQPRGGDGLWTMLNWCRSSQHATPNHAKHPSTDKSWQRHLQASARDLAIAEDSGNGSLRGQVKHDRSRGQERSEIAMAVSCFNVDNFYQFFNAKWGGMIALIYKHTHTCIIYIYIYVILEYTLTCFVRFTDWGFAKRWGPGSTQHWITHGTPSRQIVHPTFASDCTIFVETYN